MGPRRHAARVVVTRPAGREEMLLARLREAGHDPVHVPLVATEAVGDGPVDVGGYDWVVLTSVVGARELRRRMAERPRRVAAIGRATAEAFGGADLIAAESTQEGLLAAIPQPAGRVLFAGAEGARRLLPETLGADVVVLYRTVELKPRLFPDCDLVVLASPSAARAYAALGVDVPAATIGPETTRAAVDGGVRVAGEAATNDLDGLLVAVDRALAAS
jgi:uroporphyrinogen-III synthase